MPEASATSTSVAILRNRPCATTPVRASRCASRLTGFPMGPKLQSRFGLVHAPPFKHAGFWLILGQHNDVVV